MDERYEHLQSAIDCGRAWFEGEELYHHGIKNMKWGRRRYQNPDGSLTALGRVRYGVGKAGKTIGSGIKKTGKAIGGAVKAGAGKVGAKIAAKKEEKRITALMKKPIRKLTESELKERTDRADKESKLRQYEDKNEQAAKSFLSKFGSKMLNDAVIPAATEVGKNFLKKALTDALGIDGDNTFEAFKKAGFDVKKMTDKQIEALEKRTKSEKTIYETSSNIERQKKNRGIKGDDKLDSDDKPESKPNNKPESKPNNKPESKPNNKPESKPDNKPESKPDKDSKSKTDGGSNSSARSSNAPKTKTTSAYVGKGVVTDKYGVPDYLQSDPTVRNERLRRETGKGKIGFVTRGDEKVRGYVGNTVGSNAGRKVNDVSSATVDYGRKVLDDTYWEVWLNTKLRHSIEEPITNGII